MVQTSDPEGTLRLSVIVPFHKNLAQLEQCLTAIRRSQFDLEILVAADGAVDDCHALARRFNARVVEIAGPLGPAAARNRAADVASGDVLVFIDADVVVGDGTLARLRDAFASRPSVAAIFGAYDEEPAQRNFISQYKNLAHSYIHQSSNTVAQTFWAGFGAVRAQAFREVGGFDERFRRPCIEDIDLGYRLTAVGHTIVLDPTLQACHLKRWTVRSMVMSDVFDRGIPWTQLILKFGRFNADLNLRSSYRACVMLAYGMLGMIAVAPVEPATLLPVPAMMAALVALSRRYYAYFLKQRGLWFTLKVLPFHYLYHLYNGVSFAVGSGLFLLNRSADLQLPGAVPLTQWPEGAGVRLVAAPRAASANTLVSESLEG